MVLLLITSSNIEWNLTDCSVNNANSTTTTTIDITSNIPFGDFDSGNHSSSNTTKHHEHQKQQQCEENYNNNKRNNAVSKTLSGIIRKKSVRLRRPIHANPISRGVRRMRRGLIKKSLIRLVCCHDSFKRHKKDERLIGKTFPPASSNTVVNQLGNNNVSGKRRTRNADGVMSSPAQHNHTGNSPNGSNMGSLTLSNRSIINISTTSAPSSKTTTTATGTQATPHLASVSKQQAQRRRRQQQQEQFIRLYARKKRLRRRRKRKSISNNLHVSASSSEAASSTALATAIDTATTASATTATITRANTNTTNYVMFKEIHQTSKQLQQQQQMQPHHRQLQRHKQQHQMGRAVTAMRLFLTTIATLAAHTTSITLAATSTCLASATAAITIAATTLPAVWPQRFASLATNGRGGPTRARGSLATHGRDRERLPRSGFHQHASITATGNGQHGSTTDSSGRLMMHELHKYSWIFLLIYLNLSAKVCLAGYHEKRLLHDLLDPYNTLERPVLNESDPLQLSFGLTLMQIIDVDEKNQLLVTNVWLKLEWNDMNLRWNTSDYGGVKDLRIPPHRIWKPDVLMYNSADEGFDGTYQTNVVVRNNGSCLYVPPGIFKSTCKIDITWFPFDDQRCEMKFGSWTYDGFQLDLQLQDETGGDISSYVLNGEWELLGVPGKRNEIYYNCCPEPYIDITFAIIIRRRTLYYFFNLIIPCVLIASMALLGFTLPPDSGEKLSLGVTILLSLTVFLNMVAETMPATSDAVPLLGTYFNCIMFMVASSVVSTILILNYHHRNADTHEMSEWIRVVFLCWLPWILRMSRPGRPLILEFPTTPCSDTPSERKHPILSEVELKERSSKSLLANVLDIDDDFRHSCRPMTPGGTLPHNPAFYRTVYGQGDDGSIGPIGSTRMPDAVSHQCVKSSTEYELGLILKEIRFITDQLRKEDEDNDVANDWKFAAMVVDRLCLIIFTMFTILATIAVLLSAPHIIVS